MARMHSRKKGKSGSIKPLKMTKKGWIRYSSKEVEALTIKLAKQGFTNSRIGIILRDNFGIPNVKSITKKSIGKILSQNKIGSKIPEDLLALIKKDINLMKHMEFHKTDMTVKRGMQLTESKIRRLAKYYKKIGKLPKDWNYDRSRAKLYLD